MYDKVLELLKEKNPEDQFIEKTNIKMNFLGLDLSKIPQQNMTDYAAAFIPYITEGACGRRVCKYGFGRAGDTHKSLQRYRA